MYVTRGWTKPEKRKYVLGECPVVERIAEVCAHHERAVSISIIFQLMRSENRKYAANPAFFELDCKLPKLPLVDPNTLERRHLYTT